MPGWADTVVSVGRCSKHVRSAAAYMSVRAAFLLVSLDAADASSAVIGLFRSFWSCGHINRQVCDVRHRAGGFIRNYKRIRDCFRDDITVRRQSEIVSLPTKGG